MSTMITGVGITCTRHVMSSALYHYALGVISLCARRDITARSARYHYALGSGGAHPASELREGLAHLLRLLLVVHELHDRGVGEDVLRELLRAEGAEEREDGADEARRAEEQKVEVEGLLDGRAAADARARVEAAVEHVAARLAGWRILPRKGDVCLVEARGDGADARVAAADAAVDRPSISAPVFDRGRLDLLKR